MAKKRIKNYIFQPGVSAASNVYPNAYQLINSNLNYIKQESVAYIADRVTVDTAVNLFPNAVLLLTNNKTFLQDEVVAWIASQVSGNIAPCVGFTYDSAKCRRDVGYVIDAYIGDLRYGGNYRTSRVASLYWIGESPQVDGSRDPEVAAHVFLRDLINNFIFTRTLYSSLQAPVSSTQNTTGSSAEAGASARITTLASIITSVIANGLTSLPAAEYGSATFANYVYDSEKCLRDVGYVLDAYLWDLRYGGNRNIVEVSSTYWDENRPLVDGSRRPEVETHVFIKDLINTYIITNTAAPSYQVSVSQVINLGLTAEANVSTRVTALNTILVTTISNGLSGLPAVVAGVGNITIKGKWARDQILLITNTKTNTVLYNFADSSTGIFLVEPLVLGVRFSTYQAALDLDTEIDYGFTRLTFNIDTSTMTTVDEIQVFVEDYEDLRTRPHDFGTDAIERNRVASAQAMIDADFEYGLQPTKWQVVSLSRSYPGVYEVPGTDADVVTVVTDASTPTGGVGQSLITVTTIAAHGLLQGEPFSIRSLNEAVRAYSRAEGVFLVNSVPNSSTFTYYSKSRVGTTPGESLGRPSTQFRRGRFYSNADIGTASFSVVSQGSSGSINPTLIVAAGNSIIPYQGAIPSIGAPINGTGILTGTQVTAVNGTGNSGTTNYTAISGVNVGGLGIAATFNVARTSGVYSVTVNAAGTGYAATDQIIISGTLLDGTSPSNDILITVATVGGTGNILTITASGTGIATGVAETKTLTATSLLGTNDLTVSDTSGLTNGLAINRGNGVATFITNISGSTVTFSEPLTSTFFGDAASFTTLSGTNVVGSGINASFDITNTAGVYSVAVNVAGTGYLAGDTILISGSSLGGASPINDAYVTVSTVGGGGAISAATVDGTGTDSRTYFGLSPANALGFGAGAEFDVTRVGTSYTSVVLNSSIGGANYEIGDILNISGTNLGGLSPTHDLRITVTNVGGSGEITAFTSTGTASSQNFTYSSVSGSTSGEGSGATFDVSTTGFAYTSATVVNDGDATRSFRTIVSNGASLTTAEQVFGTASLRFVNPSGATPASQYADVTSATELEYGSGNFSIEFRFRFTVGGVFQILYDMRASATDDAITIALNTSNQPYLFVAGGIRITGTALTLDTWYSLALIRNSGTTTLYINGNSVGTPWSDSTVYLNRPIKLGASHTNQYGFDGFIDELRSSKGIARQTGNYTPAASRFVNDSDTQLLLHFDGENNSLTILDDVGGYKPLDTITILGSALGGVDVTNNATITVVTASYGQIQTISVSGAAADTSLYDGVTGSNLTGQGSSATVTVIRSSANYLDVIITNPGTGYVAGDIIVVSGTELDGLTDGTHDLTLTVLTVTGPGNIGTISFSGTASTIISDYLSLAGTNVASRGSGAVFSVSKSGGSYSALIIENAGSNYRAGNRIRVTGGVLGGSPITNDLTITVSTISSSPVDGEISSASVSGTAAGGQSVEFYSTISLSEPTTATISSANTLTFTALATIQVTFSSPHGLIPGSAMLVEISSGGTNHDLARGSFYIDSVPTSTSIGYSVRAPGVVASGLTGAVYSRTDAFFIHRPFDGGVMLGTGGPQHGAQAIRQSKNYIRYQSGKGLMYTTGALFAPSLDLQSASSSGIDVGSTITFVTDDVDHGLQVGANVRVIGIETPGYNGEYIVSNIVDERTFTVSATTQLASTVAQFGDQPQVSLYRWSGATVRAGCFDEQNGMYWGYDGDRMFVGVRSSTFQLTGNSTVNPGSNTVTGTFTKFREQLKAGDKIVIKGMTHTVTNIASNTTMYIAPDYRGVTTQTGVKICKVVDRVFYQDTWNKDPADGTGPSGYEIDPTKMQMIGIQYTWYGAGFIDFMLRGKEGNFLFVHRIRNNNVNTEAYMRTANLPVRYEVINDGARDKLFTGINSSQTDQIVLTDADTFPNSGIVYIDNELISYTNKNGNVLSGITRSSNLNQFIGGAFRNFTAGTAAAHTQNTGVILVSNKTTPTISHWGSAYLTDGLFDEDRGYLFNYQSTSFAATTVRQTAFLIRLAPSVSNAIVGDLGERELLNRAQLLLKNIEITAGTGNASGIVVEGILNPSNYPTNPANITWRSLNNPAFGSQPSFTQIATGNDVTWSNTFIVTFNATTNNGAKNRTNFLDFPRADVINVRIGQEISSATAGIQALIPGGTTVTGISGDFNVGPVVTRRIFFNRNFLGNIPDSTGMTFSSNVQYAAPGETIFSFVGLPNNQNSLNLTDLKEITNTTIGGRGMFPDGPDVLAINVFLTNGTPQDVSLVLRWAEAQA
jgi:hypothetical protein